MSLGFAVRRRVGIEIGRTRVRAVAIGRGGRCEPMEVDWDGSAIMEPLAGIREHFGPSGTVAVAIDPEWLFVKRVRLPPVSAGERRRILSLEPERFFPVRGEALVVSARSDDDLVFAAREAQVEAWVAAAGQLGSVERVEPAPAALARLCALQRLPTGTLLALGSLGLATCVRIVDGRVVSVRRLRGAPADAAALAAEGADGPFTLCLTPWTDEVASAVRARLTGVDVRPLPQPEGLPPEFACAYGAALGADRMDEDALVPPALARQLAIRRRVQGAAAVAALVAACAFALFSLDASQSRAVASIDAKLARLRVATADLVALQAEGARLDAEVRALDTIAAGRPNPLDVLLEVSRLLPADAYLRGIGGGTGEEWELDGYARNAAGLIPVLESSPAFADVRFRAATMRLRIGNEDYESFALALRHVPAP